jgi:hypothetical protein
MQQPHSDEVVYRDFVLSVFTDLSGCHIVKIAPTPPTFRAFITLNRLSAKPSSPTRIGQRRFKWQSSVSTIFSTGLDEPEDQGRAVDRDSLARQHLRLVVGEPQVPGALADQDMGDHR